VDQHDRSAKPSVGELGLFPSTGATAGPVRPQNRGVALVTGAGRGIGLAISGRLAQSGFKVAMASLEDRPDGLPSLGNQAEGEAVRYYRFDLAELDSHERLLDNIQEDLGEITCLVNNAGVSSLARGDLLDLGPESFDRSVAVNLKGTFFLTQAVARRLVRRATSDNNLTRCIITISSANAEIVGENRGDYCITKAGLAMMTKLFAARLAEVGIAVFEVRPGIIATEMTLPATARYDQLIEAGIVPMRRWGKPDDVATTVATLARGDIPFSTGIHLDIGGGLQIHRV
jgi:NAD(P)-dependent dehydrogenase (short-subunit alcohol dehydrogenase family)